jgi:hypothetical protein
MQQSARVRAFASGESLAIPLPAALRCSGAALFGATDLGSGVVNANLAANARCILVANTARGESSRRMLQAVNATPALGAPCGNALPISPLLAGPQLSVDG